MSNEIRNTDYSTILYNTPCTPPSVWTFLAGFAFPFFSVFINTSFFEVHFIQSAASKKKKMPRLRNAAIEESPEKWETSLEQL